MVKKVEFFQILQFKTYKLFHVFVSQTKLSQGQLGVAEYDANVVENVWHVLQTLGDRKIDFFPKKHPKSLEKAVFTRKILLFSNLETFFVKKVDFPGT